MQYQIVLLFYYSIFSFLIAFSHQISLNTWPELGSYEARSADNTLRLRIISPQHNKILHCNESSNTGLDVKVVLGLVISKSSPYVDDQAAVDVAFFSRESQSGSNSIENFYEVRRMPITKYFELGGVWFENVQNGSYDLGVGLFHHHEPGNALSRVAITIHIDCIPPPTGLIDESVMENTGLIELSNVRSNNYMNYPQFRRSEYFQKVYDSEFWKTHYQYRSKTMNTEGEIRVEEEQNWVPLESGSASGPGSSVNAARLARAAIKDILSKAASSSIALQGLPIPGVEDIIPVKPITRVVDVPCGDMTWMDIDYLIKNNISYLGLDVVPTVIEQNQKIFELRHPDAVARGQIKFQQIDIVADRPPFLEETDLLIVRHLMFHLPPSDNSAILWKITGTKVRWVLMTTYIRANSNNEDFILAVGHPVNLFRSPYCVCDASLMFRDAEPDQYLGLWDLKNYPTCFVRMNECD